MLKLVVCLTTARAAVTARPEFVPLVVAEIAERHSVSARTLFRKLIRRVVFKPEAVSAIGVSDRLTKLSYTAICVIEVANSKPTYSDPAFCNKPIDFVGAMPSEDKRVK